MISRLQASFVQIQQFSADASHELRTPVQVVEGHLALLNRWGKTDPTILDESLQTALDEVKKMKILIDEMLELARGQQLKEYPPINIRKYTDEVINEMKQLYPNVLFLHSEFDKEHLFVRISSNAIQQIMRNILINAIRYSTEPANINIFYEKSSDEVIIHIKDEGMGIPPEQLTKIFNRFYRVESARTRH
jgi:two-component system sensor histidine kinase ArlS